MIGTVAAALVVFVALPASAWHPVLSGVTSCRKGDQIVTWSIGNSQTSPTSPMTIVSATAAVGSTPFAVTGYTSPVAPGGATSAITVMPSATTGTVVLTVSASWPTGEHATREASVTLTENCVPPTTTTTVPPTTTTTLAPTTTTTVAPTTTTTTVSSSTTVITEGTTTTTTEPPTTTSTISSEGSTLAPSTTTPPTTSKPVTQSGGPGSLPFTGGGAGPAALGLLSLGLGGGLWLTSRRRHARNA